jgi:two-component system LytT family sensor kinase
MLKKFIFAAAHLIFWAVFISLSLQVGFRVSQGWDLFLSLYPVYLIHLLWAATAVYLFYFRLADILLESRRAVKFLLVTIIASPVIAMVYFSLIYLFFPDIRQLMTFRLYAGSTMTTYIMTLLGTLLKAFVNWYNAQEEKTELEKTRLQNELALLRNQVNPHFLFNTLNNIDSLIRTDADKASKAIIKLSEIMRYMLYETDQDYVTLGQEKKYLEDFIGLQRLRHKTADAIEFPL